MPTLYSLTYKFLNKPEKKKDFARTIQSLQEKSGKTKVGLHAKRSVDLLHKLLQESQDDDSKTVRKKIQALLEEREFKTGASAIEFARGVEFDKTLSVKNEKLLQFIDKRELDPTKLRRYTIDSIKEVPMSYDPSRSGTESKELIRIIEAVINLDKFESDTDRIDLGDLLKSRNWIEEDLEEQGESGESHKTRAELKALFPIRGLQIKEGGVILVYDKKAFDITELVRQTAKESYKKLMKIEGKRFQSWREKK